MMIKLTRYYDGATVFVSASHIVYLLPCESGDGCSVEAVNDANDDQPPLRVKESMEEVASHALFKSRAA